VEELEDQGYGEFLQLFENGSHSSQ
jgi:hypothetical protein